MRSAVANALISYVEALHPVIYINHFDFHVIDSHLKQVDPDAQIIEFNAANGWVDFENKSVEKEIDLPEFFKTVFGMGLGSTTFLVLKNIHTMLADPKVSAWLIRIAEKTLYDQDYNVTIFIVSPILVIPPELENYITVFDLPLPSLEEIHTIVETFVEEQEFQVESELVNDLSLALKGLNEFQIQQILNLAYQEGGYFDETDKALILREKQQLIKKAGMLELVNLSESLTNVGGLETLKKWLQSKAKVFKDLDRAMRFGVDVPKGVLIIGMPGCGKSITAKSTASLFALPLVRLDVGRLLGKYVGESEHNMRKALDLAEAISPCVLWVDELEKAFSGIGSNGGGHEVTTRLFGHFLTWMQEKQSPVFIVATANDVSRLPPEFLRKGRFDELFFVDLPNKQERQQILEIHLKKRHHWSTDLDLHKLAASCEGYNGADLEAVVQTAIEAAFIAEKKALTTEDLLAASKEIQSISETIKSKIEALKRSIQDMKFRDAR